MTNATISDPTDTTRTPEPRRYGYYANGEWLQASATFDDYEPYAGSVYAEVAACGRAETKAAIASAQAAFTEWSKTSPSARAELFLKAAEIVERRSAEFTEILIRETGAASAFAAFQQKIVVEQLRQAAGWVYQPQGEVLRSDIPGTHMTTIRRPLGVVASLTPWNGANILGWRAALYPIAAGNTVVLKPSELAPISAGLVIAEVAEEAGFPPGVLNIITHAPGEAGPVADEFFENPDVRCINFIGSVTTGRMLAERAGRALKRSVMELGGYNPLIICDDVDLDYAVRVATFSAFFHQGQICMNARKIFVEKAIYPEFLERFVAKTESLPKGDPSSPSTIIGPLITQGAVSTVNERVQDAIARGGTLRSGGSYVDQVFEPTILTEVPDDAIASCEETFGPVVLVQPVDSAEEAIEIANRSTYGLTASILSGDTYRAYELAPTIMAGSVHVNMPTIDDEIQSPLGGVRDSGWGRSGPQGLADFSDLIMVNVQSGQRHLPID